MAGVEVNAPTLPPAAPASEPMEETLPLLGQPWSWMGTLPRWAQLARRPSWRAEQQQTTTLAAFHHAFPLVETPVDVDPAKEDEGRMTERTGRT